MKTISSIKEKTPRVKPQMNPHEYSDRKVSEITLDAIIIHYTNIKLDNIPDYAKEKISLAINPQMLHTKYSPQVFVALSRFNVEILDYFKESIIEGLKFIIDKSSNDNYVNKSFKILSETYGINHKITNTVSNVKTQVSEAFTYQNKKDKLCDLIELNMDTIRLEDNDYESVSISDLLKINKIKKGKKVKSTNLDIINILTDIYNENPDFLSKNFTGKKKGFDVSKEMEVFIQDYVSLRDNDNLRNNSFPELKGLSMEFSLSETDLLDVIIFNKLYTKATKLIPITRTKSTTFSLNNELIVEYMQRIGKIKNNEI